MAARVVAVHESMQMRWSGGGGGAVTAAAAASRRRDVVKKRETARVYNCRSLAPSSPYASPACAAQTSLPV